MSARAPIALAAALALGTGCEPAPRAVAEAHPLLVVPRAAVPNIYTYRGATGYALARLYPGEIVAVVGYGFAPFPADNTVSLGPPDGEPTCPVVGGRILDRHPTLGTLSALYFVVPEAMAPATGVAVRVATGGVEPNPPATVAVHRLLFAAPSAGATVTATDVALAPPGWEPAHDVIAPGTPDVLVVTPDARFAVVTTGTTLAVVLLADGQAVAQATGFLNGPAGPAVGSPDGRWLALGVFPPGGAPELALVDLSALAATTFTVDGTTGLVRLVGPAPAIPAATTVALGGAAPGRLATDRAGSRVLATLSSGVLREWAVTSPGAAAFVRDVALGTGTAPFGLAVTPDDARALVTDLANDTLIPVELSPLRVRTPLATGTAPLDVVVSPDGSRAVVPCAASQDAAVFDLSAGGVVFHSPRLVALGFAPGPAVGLPDLALGQGAGSRVAVVDGNRIRFLAIDGAGAVTVDPAAAGPFAQPLVALATAK